MDAHQLFWDYHVNNILPRTDEYSDNKTQKLVALMKSESTGETKEVEVSETLKDSETVSETDRETLMDSETVETVPMTPQKRRPSIDTKSAAIAKCDTLCVNHGWHKNQINNIAKNTHCTVDMQWVKAVASSVIGEISNDFCMIHDSNRHVHVIGGVKQFLQAFNNPLGEVTTFSWTINSQKAIHVTDFKAALQKMAPPESEKQVMDAPLLLLMIACSIGLPTKKMYNSVTFLTRWKNYRYKILSNRSIITTILRDKFSSIAKIGIESKQLLDEYTHHSHLFSTNSTATTVKNYFFDEWYSYPSPTEMQHLLERVVVLKESLLNESLTI